MNYELSKRYRNSANLVPRPDDTNFSTTPRPKSNTHPETRVKLGATMNKKNAAGWSPSPQRPSSSNTNTVRFTPLRAAYPNYALCCLGGNLAANDLLRSDNNVCYHTQSAFP